MSQTQHINLVSCSGGKDSTATLLLALKQFPDTTTAAFVDTGNEHEATVEYIYYLEQELGIRIEHVRQDFTDLFARRRNYILTKWPEKGVPMQRCEEAAACLVPSGNPFLDLCMLKGRFPSRKMQFCTMELKTYPLTELAMWYAEFFDTDVWSWQGVRRDESAKRANVLGFERTGSRIFCNRPIAGWTAQETVDFVRSCGLKLNPLYSQGMNRVGCMPCINANKAELAEIYRRFPEHIERIAQWEEIVRSVSKNGAQASFIPAPGGEGRADRQGRNINEIVRWAMTKRGGLEYNEIYDEPPAVCSSSYGLCE